MPWHYFEYILVRKIRYRTKSEIYEVTVEYYHYMYMYIRKQYKWNEKSLRKI